MQLGHHAGMGGPAIIHPTAGVTEPPAHDPVSIGLILLVLAILVLAPVAAGIAVGYQPARRREQAPRHVSLDPGPAITGVSIRDWGVSRTFRIAVTLFMSPCEDCGAVRGQPCKLIPRVQTIVIDEERWWCCHIPRVAKGVAADKALYMALLSEWTGPLPAELKELYDDEA